MIDKRCNRFNLLTRFPVTCRKPFHILTRLCGLCEMREVRHTRKADEHCANPKRGAVSVVSFRITARTRLRRPRRPEDSCAGAERTPSVSPDRNPEKKRRGLGKPRRRRTAHIVARRCNSYYGTSNSNAIGTSVPRFVRSTPSSPLISTEPSSELGQSVANTRLRTYNSSAPLPKRA